MSRAVRKSIVTAAALAMTALAGFLSSGVTMALVWECIHRTGPGPFYCAEAVMVAMPYLFVALLFLVFLGSWWGTWRWMNARFP